MGAMRVAVERDKSPPGLLVTKIGAGGLAEWLELRVGDVVVAVNDLRWTERIGYNIRSLFNNLGAGDSIVVTILRDGKEIPLEKTLPDNFDPDAYGEEMPVHEVALDPFFISKYEMTQGQWQHLTGVNPSFHRQWLGRRGLGNRTSKLIGADNRTSVSPRTS